VAKESWWGFKEWVGRESNILSQNPLREVSPNQWMENQFRNRKVVNPSSLEGPVPICPFRKDEPATYDQTSANQTLTRAIVWVRSVEVLKGG